MGCVMISCAGAKKVGAILIAPVRCVLATATGMAIAFKRSAFAKKALRGLTARSRHVRTHAQGMVSARVVLVSVQKATLARPVRQSCAPSLALVMVSALRVCAHASPDFQETPAVWACALQLCPTLFALATGAATAPLGLACALQNLGAPTAPMQLVRKGACTACAWGASAAALKASGEWTVL